MNLIIDVVRDKKDELIATVSIMLLIIVMSSTLMYYVESDVQPEAFPNIVASFWWAVATLTTVGYGDVYPITAGGKILSSVIAISGIGLVALPTGILSSGFMDGMNKEKNDKAICPKCGYDCSGDGGKYE
jgi:voltage-gated potassium channel